MPLCAAEAACIAVGWTARRLESGSASNAVGTGTSGSSDGDEADEELAVALWSGCNLLKLAGDAVQEAAGAAALL